MSRYEENRTKFPLEELWKYAGQWVAFSLDGRHILASGGTLPDLEERLAVAGKDPQQAAFERIELEDNQLGGAEVL